MNEEVKQPAREASYGKILRSSAILGGAQGLIYLILIGRTKMVAVLLGPAGMGTFGLYQSTITLVSTVSNLGLSTSGVREVAEAESSTSAEALDRSICNLRRISLLAGILGWALTAIFAYPLCLFTFKSPEHTWALALLGSSIVFTSIAGGGTAILQGRRRLGDLARVQIFSTSLGTVLSVLLYAWLGERGIIPSIILSSIIYWIVTRRYTRSLPVPGVRVSWSETLRDSKRMIFLGIAFMWNSMMVGAVAFGARAMIVRDLGLEANGIYQAAWGISGMFAGFILAAMGTDFLPRLTAASADTGASNQLVNEQTEIGILLSLPSLLFTLALSPWIMELFYSREFVEGGKLLPWFVVGVFVQIVSWPMGFIQVARGASRTFVVTQTIFNLLHFSLMLLLFRWFGLTGFGGALIIANSVYALAMLIYCKKVTRFSWSPGVIRLVVFSLLSVLSAFGFTLFLERTSGSISVAVLGMLAAVFSVRGLTSRLPDNHRLHRLISRIRRVALLKS